MLLQSRKFSFSPSAQETNQLKSATISNLHASEMVGKGNRFIIDEIECAVRSILFAAAAIS